MRKGSDKMQDLFDEELKELLQGTKIQVPESYDKKVEETLSNVSIPSKKRYLHLFYSKTAAVIVMCYRTRFFSGSGGSTESLPGKNAVNDRRRKEAL